jgi:hypothetical protein
MPSHEPPLSIPHTINSAHFPVYGFTNPEEFSIRSISLGHFGNPSQLNSISLTFSSSRYPEEHNSIVVSSATAEIQSQGNGKIIYDLRDPSDGPLFNFDTYVFQYYHLNEKERIQAGAPSVWEGTLPIDSFNFSAKVRSWSLSHNLSLYLLKIVSYTRKHVPAGKRAVSTTANPPDDGFNNALQ